MSTPKRAAKGGTPKSGSSKGSSPKGGGEDAESLLATKFTAKALKSCSAHKLQELLLDLSKQLQPGGPISDRTVDAERAAQILDKTGFAKEIMRDAFLSASTTNQILVGGIILGLLLLTAPEMPFEGHEKKLFVFLLRQLQHLQGATKDSEVYRKCFAIAEHMGESKILTLLSDCENTEEQVRQLFDLCLNKLGARAEEEPALCKHLQDLLMSVLDDAPDVDEDVMNMFIVPLTSEGKKKNPGGNRVSKGVVRRLDEKLVSTLSTHIGQRLDDLERDIDDESKDKKPLLQEFKKLLTVVMELGDPREGHPSTLTFLLPHVAAKLANDNPFVRNVVSRCFGKLFEGAPRLADTHGGVFTRFMHRFNDNEREIRVWMLQWAGRYLSSGPANGTAREQVAEQLKKQVGDHDELVRREAIGVVVQVCHANLDAPPAALLDAAVERIRDRKLGVRKKAMVELTQLYIKATEEDAANVARYAAIPAHVLSAHMLHDGENAPTVEHLALTLLPAPEADDAEGEGHSALTVQLVRLWAELPKAARASFARFIQSKGPVRELVRRMVQFRQDTKPSSDKSQDEQREAKQNLITVVRQLNKMCRYQAQHGADTLLYVRDERFWKMVESMAADPAKMFSVREKAVAQLKAYVKGGGAERTAQLKDVPDVAQGILTKAAFPISVVTARELLSLLKARWEMSDGPRCELLSDLLTTLVASFREVFTDDAARADLVELTISVAEQETGGDGYGSEDEDAAAPAPPGTPLGRKKLKIMLLSQRRGLLARLLHVLRRLNAAEGGALGGVSDADKKQLMRELKRLCSRSPEHVVKQAMLLLRALTDGSPAQEKLFASIVAEAVASLDSLPPHKAQALAALRAAQQCYQLCPAAMERHAGGVLKYVRERVLTPLSRKRVDCLKEHSFANPPAQLRTYRMALKVFAAAMLVVDGKKEEAARMQDMFGELMGWLQSSCSKEPPLASAVQTADTVKAILRLGRDNDLRRLCFNLNPKNKSVYRSLAYCVMLCEHPDTRNEIGRKIHKGLMSGQLALGFTQLLIPLLQESNPTVFRAARERVQQVVAYFRERCKQASVKLDSQLAPAFCPEYIVPHMVYLLSRYPDLSKWGPSYEPVQKVIFIFLDALTKDNDCSSFLFDFLRRMKHYDTADSAKNTNARLVCDLAFQVLRSVTDTKEVKVRPFPGLLLMPVCYKKCDDVAKAEANYLDERHFVPLRRDQLLKAAAAAGAPAAEDAHSPGGRASPEPPGGAAPKRPKRGQDFSHLLHDELGAKAPASPGSARKRKMGQVRHRSRSPQSDAEMSDAPASPGRKRRQ